MQITFIYTDNPNLSEVESYNRFTQSFQFPDTALELSNIEQRVLNIAHTVGKLTKASLHVTCRAVGLNNHHIKDCDYDYNDRMQGIHRSSQTAKIQCRIIAYGVRTLTIYHPITPVIEIRYSRKSRPSISYGIRPNRYESHEQQAFVQLYRDLADNLLGLLNTYEGANWLCEQFHPWYPDNQLIKDINKSFRARERTQRKKEIEAKKPSTKVKGKPHPETGAGRGVGAIPGKFMGVQMRSQLEIRLAAELQDRGIEWIYEQERLGEGNYLVDFHLPKHQCWIEVKGKVEARDKFLLTDVAKKLLERDEKLYMYTSRRTYEVTINGFQAGMKHDDFWKRFDPD